VAVAAVAAVQQEDLVAVDQILVELEQGSQEVVQVMLDPPLVETEDQEFKDSTLMVTAVAVVAAAQHQQTEVVRDIAEAVAVAQEKL
jgi:hypothetical protein